MKYWNTTATTPPQVKRQHIEQMILGGDYIFSEKIDGNWSRAIITHDRAALQTRGISKKTGTYGEVQNKVLFWNNVVDAFQNGDTIILGEIYLPGGIDKDCGSILRCLDEKAIARQKDKQLHWKIFDVLAIDGQIMLNYPVEKRVSYIPEVVKRINSPLVAGVTYQQMDNNFFDIVNDIFSRGGEGVVCYKKSAIYEPGKRGPHAWDTLKVKQEIATDVDCFIIGVEPATKTYTGKDIGNWELWQNVRTGEKLMGQYFGPYRMGEPYEPISKNYYYGWPGAIIVGVYDANHKIVPLCKVAGLTEDFKTQLRDNFQDWYLCPVTIGGMMVSTAQQKDASGLGISIRHPYLKVIRQNDIDIDDCTLEKIIS